MHIRREDLLADKTLALRLKAWGHKVNTAAKDKDAPVFKVRGPMRVKTRIRIKGYPTQHRDYMGDEEFRINQLLIERDNVMGTADLALLMNPVSQSLAAEVVGLTLPLVEAIEVFDGLEDWLKLEEIETIEPMEAKPKEPVLPTVEETRAAQTWGAW